MALNDIKFRLGQGGLGRALPGQDYISAFAFYAVALPSGFSTTNRIKQFFSVDDAEAAGILADYHDETKATASYLVTNAGATGDTATFKVAEPFGTITTIATYTRLSTDTTVNLVATGIAAAINAGTNTHGYSAVAATATVTITARAGLGVFLNTGTPLTASIVGTIAGTITQFTGGVASEQAVWHYHISEYFRLQPQGNLYVGLFAVPGGTYTFTEIATMQNFSGGIIRQIGVYKTSSVFSAADLDTINAVCEALVSTHMEIVAIYAGDISAVSDISTLADLSLKSDNLVMPIISQDGGALGARLFAATGKTISDLGAKLGAVSLAKVNESIAWVAKFNFSDGTELDTPAFGNGVLLSASSVNDNLLSALQDKRYVFLRKFVGVDGTYANENSMAIAVSSDYAYMSDNRTIQKATRGVYKTTIPALNSPVALNKNGTLTDTTIAYFEGLAETSLIQMLRDAEISEKDVVINPAQDVLSTGIITMTISIVPYGTARNIVINIGFNVSIN